MKTKIKEINIDGERKLKVIKQVNEDEYIVKCPECGKQATYTMPSKYYCEHCPQLRFYS